MVRIIICLATHLSYSTVPALTIFYLLYVSAGVADDPLVIRAEVVALLYMLFIFQ